MGILGDLRGGYINPGIRLINAGYGGDIYASTPQDGSSDSYYLSFYNTIVIASGDANRYHGRSVRCVGDF